MKFVTILIIKHPTLEQYVLPNYNLLDRTHFTEPLYDQETQQHEWSQNDEEGEK